MSPAAETTYLDAILRPHRSLGRRGFRLLMIAVGLVGLCAGMAFVLIGAWPVFGFFGIEALLIYLAFRLNYRAARMFERLHLTERALTVERVGPASFRAEWRFQPYWLRVSIDTPALPTSPLVLRSHGRSLAIGAFLPPAERLAVAEALRAALDRLKSARF